MPGDHVYEAVETDKICNIAWEDASFFSKWTFSIANSMLYTGIARPLQFDDTFPVSGHDRVERLTKLLSNSYLNSKSCFGLPRLLVALLRCHEFEYSIVMMYAFIEGCIRIMSPVVLLWFLQDLESSSVPVWRPYMFAALLGTMNLAQTLIHHVLFFFSMRLGWNWKAATTGLVFQRLFLLSGGKATNDTKSTGKLVNLISNDVSFFEEFSVSFLELAAILFILTLQLTFLPALAGVGMTLVFIPVQLSIGARFAKMRGRTAGETDQRVRHISEVIDGISTVKSYSWEIPFFNLIKKCRIQEMFYMTKSQTCKAANFGLYYSIPPLAAFATFTVYWALGNTLTLPKIFSVLSMLQVLKLTMGRQWTRSVETGSEAFAACYRLESYLSMTDVEAADLMKHVNGGTTVDMHGSNANITLCVDTEGNEMDEKAVEMLRVNAINPTIDDSSSVLVKSTGSSYTYDQLPSEGGITTTVVPILSNISFSLQQGELLMVIGSVGSGKSSFLSAVLGELSEVPSKDNTTSSLHRRSNSRLAYCCQQPWVFAGTVRANVELSGETSDKHGELYSYAMESASLVDDLHSWPDYDETEIGERGISVSGGQKARISLARAMYSDADLYLLDDPLSAVDAHVGKALFFDCIMQGLVARNKGVILVTHQLQYLSYATNILVLDSIGQQSFYGTYSDLMKRSHEFPYLGLTASVTSGSSGNSKATSPSPEYPGNGRTPSPMPSKAMAKFDKNYLQQQKEGKMKIVKAEDRVEGSMLLSVYASYIRAGGVSSGVFALVLACIAQILLMITEYWLRCWAGGTFWSESNDANVWLYAILVLCCLVMGFGRAILWFQFTLRASSNLHSYGLWAVIRSPLTFFHANPTGRILNRFSRDQNIADEQLPSTTYDFIQTALQCLAGFLLVCVALPWMLLFVPFLLYYFLQLRTTYIKSSREVKRLEAVTRSPIYSTFSACLDGLITLRAYGLEDKMTKTFFSLVDSNGQCWFSFLMLSRWLGFRLDLGSGLLVLLSSLLAVALRNTTDVGLLGFALVYALSLSGLLQWCVRQSVEVETKMTSIERLESYSKLVPEPGYANASLLGAESGTELVTNTTAPAAPDTIARGNISIRELVVTYREDMEPVLNELSLDIAAGAKIGICGRTGCGKSSLLLALLRLNIVTSGDVQLDGKSLLSCSLESCRSKLSIIPQDPHLFSGTVRFNLDPFSQYTDEEIWTALGDAHIKETVEALDAGLSHMVEEGGKNFSVGQRQLMSLARAVLRHCRVILMDEVSASIDFVTDKLIQSTIRSSGVLRNATIITIAHRLRTIADSDEIVVLDFGKLVERGAPHALLSQTATTSYFRSLAEESNELEDIVNIAAEAYSSVNSNKKQ